MDSSANDQSSKTVPVTAGADGELLERLTLELIEFVQWHERNGIKRFTPRQILDSFWTHKTIRGNDAGVK